MNTTDFGPAKPSIQPYLNGYSVPAGLKQVERPAINGEGARHSWQGYLLIVPFLSDLELDAAIKGLPPGDYSTDKRVALDYLVQQERRAAYPPIEDYIDGVVKGDDAQIAAYKAKCLAVKAAHPLSWDATAAYKVGELVAHDGKRWKATSDNTGNQPDSVPGDWEEVTL
jgi:hypothetical protein